MEETDDDSWEDDEDAGFSGIDIASVPRTTAGSGSSTLVLTSSSSSSSSSTSTSISLITMMDFFFLVRGLEDSKRSLFTCRADTGSDVRL